MKDAKTNLVSRLSARLGKKATPGQVIDELYRLGALDDVLATHALIKDEFEHRMASTMDSKLKVVTDLCVRYSRSESGMHYIIGKGG